tara:strand:- start:12505 stop:12879 length:375 start_codon:yes stop_codon:yes gene_type:complete
MEYNKNIIRTSRQLKFGENLRKSISLILQTHVFHDPILDDVTIIVTEVRVSPDLSNASVYILALGENRNNSDIIDCINLRFRKLVGPLTRELKLRRAPKFNFIYDDSYERQAYIDNLIAKAKRK